MVRLNRIYTRTGDAGTSGLVDGSRLPKDDALFDAIGDVDEANAAIGLALAAMAGDDPYRDALIQVQNELFDLGADLATPAGADEDFAPSAMVLRIVPAQVARLERAIDAMNEGLPPLKSFILPGGNAAAGALHMARATVRRAERAMVRAGHGYRLNPAALAYGNRLSDYLFVLCRVLAARDGGERVWVPGASRAD